MPEEELSEYELDEIREKALKEEGDKAIAKQKYNAEADSLWNYVTKQGMDEEDKSSIYNSLVAGDMGAAVAKAKGVDERRQAEAEYQEILQAYGQGKATREQYEAAMKKRGKS